MMTLTGGEKYKVKTTIVDLNKLYPEIDSILKQEGFESNSSSLDKLYEYSLQVFTMLSKLTLNMLDSDKVLKEEFDDLQKVHYYSKVRDDTKEALIKACKQVPNVIEALINMGEGDTTARDSALKQIMEELGIVDPNAKKHRSFWDN